jgi:UDP-N-acetylglucosamine 1-carboxyvinyltransferase
MDKIQIYGGKPLSGTIVIGGSKNASLPVMCASLLTDEPLILGNVPHLADITTMANLLSQHGVEVSLEGHDDNEGHIGRVLSLHAKDINNTKAPYDLVRKMRASVLVLGPLLARAGEAEVSLPGGCAIGTRPVDLHLNGLRQLGANISVDGGYIYASAPKGLFGSRIIFPKVSVGATENLILASVLAEGKTVLQNAAKEPEINDLINCLNAMGAKIEGIGTSALTINGVDKLHGTRHAIMPDRIEAGTYAIAAAITGGKINLSGARLNDITTAVDSLRLAGINIQRSPNGILVDRSNSELKSINIETAPYPGFPTDLQAQFISLMSVANGTSIVTETIFENRFMHVPELQRMGADITVDGGSAIVRGTRKLTGAPVMASDLRASASLVLAGLIAEGKTTVRRIYHLDRGYERLEEKLASVGAEIIRLKDEM